MTYKIKKLDSSEDNYSDFVNNHNESLLYHSLPYINLISSLTDSTNTTLIALDSKDTILAVLPMLTKNGPYGDVDNSLPFYGSNGGILSDDLSAQKELIKFYNKNVSSKASSTVVENPISSSGSLDFSWNYQDHRIGQFTDLDLDTSSPDELMAIFHQKTRNMVRKAQKEGIEVLEQNDEIEYLAEMHRENIAAVNGIAKKKEFFEKIPNYFKAGEDYKIFLASYNKSPIAALLLFYFNETVEYFTPVVNSLHRDKQPLSLLIFEAMQQASASGYRRWNWGGTWPSQEGVHRFKKRWGTYDKNYLYKTQLNNLDILNASQNELLSAYENFFVLPFDQLNVNTND